MAKLKWAQILLKCQNLLIVVSPSASVLPVLCQTFLVISQFGVTQPQGIIGNTVDKSTKHLTCVCQSSFSMWSCALHFVFGGNGSPINATVSPTAVYNECLQQRRLLQRIRALLFQSKMC